MNQPRFIRLGIILILALVLSIPQTTFAQATIDLAVHYVEGVPSESGIAYDVSVYLSVVDAAGDPVKDLTAASFTVAEDSQQVAIKSLGPAESEPINIVLVLDTSGSMAGSGINAAKAAAENFVAGLKSQDRVAVVTFDNEVKTRLDFTDKLKTAVDQISTIDAVRGSGTCLYDAAYRAIQMTSTLPSGRRAVILFTDGVDQTPTSSKPCSIHTLEDVITLAASGGTRTPIYTLGLGTQIDVSTLKRLSDLTGGRHSSAPDATQLDSEFQRLADQLRSQYVLKYQSSVGPGAHTLAVSVNYQNAQDSDTRNFLLPALPPRLTFTSPQDGTTITDRMKVTILVTGQGTTVERVAFAINDAVVGTDTSTPYELELDLQTYSLGNLTLSAIAYGANDSELARQSITIIHVAPTVAPTAVPAQPTSMPSPLPTQTPQDNTMLIIGGGLGGLGLLIILLLVFMLFRQREQTKGSGEPGTNQSSAPPRAYPDSVATSVKESRTMDGGSDILGALTVEASDDATMIGHRFEITSALVTLGRSADNDIIFPNDTPVSRRHAEIFERNGKLYLRELESLDSSGAYKPPKYGTFLNDLPLTSDQTPLKTGDVIVLGKRVRLKFEAYKQAEDNAALTYDDMTSSSDPDKTQDQF